MGKEMLSHSSDCNSVKTPANTTLGPEHGAMSKADRKQLVLEYLAVTGLGLPPAVLYRNLRLRQNATFSQKTLHNYLEELAAEGLLMRIDPDAMEERELVEIDDGRAYWMATDAGREAADDSFSFH